MKGLKYLVILEQGPTSWGAHVPDLPGCIAVNDSKEAVIKEIRKAIEFHIEGMIANGENIPKPTSSSETVEVG